ASRSASRAAASMRRAPSRQISSSASVNSGRASSSATTLNIGVTFLTGVSPPALVFGQRGRDAAPQLRWPIHKFWLYLRSPKPSAKVSAAPRPSETESSAKASSTPHNSDSSNSPFPASEATSDAAWTPPTSNTDTRTMPLSELDIFKGSGAGRSLAAWRATTRSQDYDQNRNAAPQPPPTAPLSSPCNTGPVGVDRPGGEFSGRSVVRHPPRRPLPRRTRAASYPVPPDAPVELRRRGDGRLPVPGPGGGGPGRGDRRRAAACRRRNRPHRNARRRLRGRGPLVSPAPPRTGVPAAAPAGGTP